MFAKKQSSSQSLDVDSLTQPFKQLSLNSTHSHHQFFLLVRDQKYDQAYILGQKILNENPNNPAIQHFCDFIKNNAKGIKQMLQEQEYTDGSDDDDYEYQDQEDDDQQQDQEDDEDSQEEENQKKSQKPSSRSSSQSIVSKVSQSSIKQQPALSKINKKLSSISIKQISNKQLNKENAHKWDHNCKNPNCPNKNKPHRH